MLADYHMHTVLCRHAHGTPEEYAAEAVRKGLADICINVLTDNRAQREDITTVCGPGRAAKRRMIWPKM